PLFCSTMPPSAPTSTLFPYTTLFRSRGPIRSRPGVFPLGVRNRRRGGNHGHQFVLPTQRRREQAKHEGRARRPSAPNGPRHGHRSEEHTSELQSLRHLVCRLLLEKKK